MGLLAVLASILLLVELSRSTQLEAAIKHGREMGQEQDPDRFRQEQEDPDRFRQEQEDPDRFRQEKEDPDRFRQEKEDPDSFRQEQDPDSFRQEQDPDRFRQEQEDPDRFRQEQDPDRFRQEQDPDRFRHEKEDPDSFRQEQDPDRATVEGDGDFSRIEGDDDFSRKAAIEGDDDFSRKAAIEGDDDFLFNELAMMQNGRHSKPPKLQTGATQAKNPDDYQGEAMSDDDMLADLQGGHSKPSKSPRKVTFEENTDMQALIERLDRSESFEGAGDDDSDALSQWVMVTSEGYEYAADQDEVEEVFRQSRESIAKTSEFTKSSFSAVTDQMRMQVSTNATSQRVIGHDSRYKVRYPKRYPYSAMGRVQSGCTGTFIGPGHILTAGHCVFNPYSRKWIRSLNFQRGKGCNPNRGYYHYWKNAVTVWGWYYGKLNYNYAVIVVKTPSPSWLSFGWKNPMPRYYVNTAGYPIDKSRRCLWKSSCWLGTRYHTMMTHTCDTYNGMSGGPVYTHFKLWHFKFSVVFGVQVGSGRYLNLSVRINKRRYYILRYIMRRYR